MGGGKIVKYTPFKIDLVVARILLEFRSDAYSVGIIPGNSKVLEAKWCLAFPARTLPPRHLGRPVKLKGPGRLKVSKKKLSCFKPEVGTNGAHLFFAASRVFSHLTQCGAEVEYAK